MRAKIQQNLRICKFCVEKVLRGIKVKYFLADGKAPQKSRFFGDPATARLNSWRDYSRNTQMYIWENEHRKNGIPY